MFTHLILTVLLLFAGIQPFSGINKVTIYPVPTPFEVYVYRERVGECPVEEDRIMSLLPMAFKIHRDAVIRFVGELGGEYDDLLRVRFGFTDYRGDATVIFRVKDLEPPFAGLAAIGGSLPHEVSIDCDVGKSNVSDYFALQIIMHELYHTLGIGHAERDVPGEIMGYYVVDGQYVYPSTLVLYALYKRYFNPPATETVVSLPPDIPYVQSRPFSETMEKLSATVSQLNQQNKELSTTLRNDITALRNDIIFLSNTTNMLESKLNNMESRIDDLNSELAGMSGRLSTAELQLNNLRGEVSGLREGQRSINESISDIQRLLDRNGREIELLRGSLTALSTELEKQSRMITILSLVVLVLSAAVPAVAVYFRRRGGG
ncbi:MAG: hypothetical protein QW580_01980 [Nitrososphaerota archaeon]